MTTELSCTACSTLLESYEWEGGREGGREGEVKEGVSVEGREREGEREEENEGRKEGITKSNFNSKWYLFIFEGETRLNVLG